MNIRGEHSQLMTENDPRKGRETLTVIVPVFNEEDVVAEFHTRLSEVLNSIDLEADVIYVNDGSHDHTLAILRSLREQDPRIGIIDFSRNFGKEIALTAGLDHSTGDGVVIIDVDLQHPPELIPDFVRIWREEEVDVVYGLRTTRKGETVLKKVTSYLFYRVIEKVGGVKIPRNSGDFRLLDRSAVDALKKFPEHHRFMKGLFAWIGFEQVALPYESKPRYAGESKWNYWRLWNFAVEGLTSHTVAPLKLASYLGLAVSLVAFLYGAYIISKTLMYGDPVAGYPSLMVAVLFFGGVQLFFTGILGEYLGRVFNETKRRPLYIVRTHDKSAKG
jgi:polyisoprenyl-phosphate glycosyltransferase